MYEGWEIIKLEDTNMRTEMKLKWLVCYLFKLRPFKSAVWVFYNEQDKYF